MSYPFKKSKPKKRQPAKTPAKNDNQRFRAFRPAACLTQRGGFGVARPIKLLPFSESNGMSLQRLKRRLVVHVFLQAGVFKGTPQSLPWVTQGVPFVVAPL